MLWNCLLLEISTIKYKYIVSLSRPGEGAVEKWNKIKLTLLLPEPQRDVSGYVLKHIVSDSTTS